MSYVEYAIMIATKDWKGDQHKKLKKCFSQECIFQTTSQGQFMVGLSLHEPYLKNRVICQFSGTIEAVRKTVMQYQRKIGFVPVMELEMSPEEYVSRTAKDVGPVEKKRMDEERAIRERDARKRYEEEKAKEEKANANKRGRTENCASALKPGQ